MNVFISHNRADKEFARSLATALAAMGAGVWFDDWEVEPGSSLTGGIEQGLKWADTFVLVWSAAAAKSRWVGLERAAFVRRMVDEQGLRIIPLMLDDSELPALVADYKGFHYRAGEDILTIAAAIVGGGAAPDELELAQVLQHRLLEIAEDHLGREDPFGVVVCPRCGSRDLRRSSASNDDRTILMIDCNACHWRDWTEC